MMELHVVREALRSLAKRIQRLSHRADCNQPSRCVENGRYSRPGTQYYVLRHLWLISFTISA
jgi:hypothetical protein